MADGPKSFWIGSLGSDVCPAGALEDRSFVGVTVLCKLQAAIGQRLLKMNRSGHVLSTVSAGVVPTTHNGKMSELQLEAQRLRWVTPMSLLILYPLSFILCLEMSLGDPFSVHDRSWKQFDSFDNS